MKQRALGPHTEPIAVGDTHFTSEEIIGRLTPFVSDRRKRRVAAVISQRTYSVVPVLEGLYDRGNVSAVIRTAEALGFQAVHVIESSEKFKEARRVTQGAEKWLDVQQWEQTAPCLEHLRGLGYGIVAVHAGGAKRIEDIVFDSPTAFFFGNEHEGLSDEVMKTADAQIALPMTGFTRSYNISVAAALVLYHLYEDRLQRPGTQGDLSDGEKRILTALYYMRSVAHAEEILLEGETSRSR